MKSRVYINKKNKQVSITLSKKKLPKWVLKDGIPKYLDIKIKGVK